MSLHAGRIPLTFGRLFGTYHPPLGAARGVGVLLVKPLGWEGLSAHRSERALAERLAEAGFSVLRFDLDGTGDSVGSDEDPARVDAWLESIRSAFEKLRELSGCTTFGLFSLHLSATLAAQVASESPRFASAVFWSPFTQGKQYLRQVRAYRALNPSANALPEGDEEAAGFYFHAETLQALTGIHLLELPVPAPRVLLLGRDGAEPDGKLTRHWNAETHPGTGYAEMMQEPRKTVVPEATLSGIVSWFSNAHPSRDFTPPPVSPAALRPLTGPGYVEDVSLLGQTEEMLSFVTRPAESRAHRTAIVFLNTASDHRVGPSRMYVRLARELAQDGFVSLRFDPAGIGDSVSRANRDEAHAYSSIRLKDVETVLDSVARRGLADRFVLVGLCSGAYMAFHAAEKDPRVVGQLLINPQTFVWREGDSMEVRVKGSFKSTGFYKRAMFDRRIWGRMMKGHVNVLGIARTVVTRAAAKLAKAVLRALPSLPGEPLRLDRAFRKQLDRGVEIYVLFGENDGGIDLLEEQLGARGGSLRKHPRFRFEVLAGPDHTFSAVQDQRSLFKLVRHHVQRFTASASAP